MFMVSFMIPEWIRHEHGFAGLWSECRVNASLPPPEEEQCEQSATAEGPDATNTESKEHAGFMMRYPIVPKSIEEVFDAAFLELVRALLIVALVCEFVGVIGYNLCLPKEGGHRAFAALQERLQEISYLLAGVFITGGIALYGVDVYDYYTETKGFSQVQLRWCFYLMGSVGVMDLLLSVSMSCTRYTKHAKRQRSATSSKSKYSKTSPDLNLDDISMDQRGESDNAINDLVTIKTTAFKRIVTPTVVVLAFNKAKAGTGLTTKNKEKVSDKRRASHFLPQQGTNVFTSNKTDRGVDERLPTNSFSLSPDNTNNYTVITKNNSQSNKERGVRLVNALDEDTSLKVMELQNYIDNKHKRIRKPKRGAKETVKDLRRTTHSNRRRDSISHRGTIYTVPTQGEIPTKHFIGQHFDEEDPQHVLEKRLMMFQV